LIVSMLPAFVLKVCRNRFSCHARSVAELPHPNCSILAMRQSFKVSKFQLSRLKARLVVFRP
jgi:hypothetical protein